MGNTAEIRGQLSEALYGDAGQETKRLGFDYLPKVDRNYSWVQLWDDMYNGSVKGMLAFA